MSGINMGRVLLGGVVAGLVINVGEYVLNMMVLKTELEAATARMNLPPVDGSAIGTFVTLAFVLGITTMWLYASIRPRFGAGPRTAACAGATAWFLAYAYPSASMYAMGMFDASTIAIALVWGLVEVVLAAVAGASLYQEQGTAAAARV